MSSPQGSNRGGGSSTVSGFLSTLIPTGLIALGWVGFFLWFRSRQKRIYQPRTYLGRFSAAERTPKASDSMFGWLKDFFALSDDFILTHHSLDGYLYIRYLKMLTLISFVGCFITWPVLFPVYATGGNNSEQFTGFNTLTYGKVENANRYYATTFIAWIFFTFVLYMIGRESLHYVAIRQAYFTSPFYSSRISSRTVLFTDVPERYLDEQKIRSLFHGVKSVWLATDTDELSKLVKERDKTAMRLESAECALSRNANTRRLKAEKKRAKGKKAEELSGLQWIDEKKRPTHKLGFLGCFGEKVDSINWSRDHLKEVIPLVEKEQEAHWSGKAKQIPALFIEFETVALAQAAFQQQVSHTPKIFQPRCIGVRPSEVIWSGLSKPWFRRDILYTASTALVVVTIIFWSVPISFGGFLTNIKQLTQIPGFSWLSFINNVPSQILGIISNLIPVIWVAVLMALVPIFCRLLAKVSGAISVPEVELTTQGWYFGFQVVNVFLITTFASGASGVLGTVFSQPSMAPKLLAQNLPTASNFYVSYFILYGTAFAGSALANAAALALFYVLGYILDKTPRKKFARYANVGGIAWGSAYPPISLLGVIILSYATLAPLVLGFAAVGLFLVYLANRYLMLYCLDTTSINTQGVAYGKAIQQLMTGVYIAEVCLVGLFAITSGSQRAALGPMILMIIFLIATILYHRYLSAAIAPLARTLPRDLTIEDGAFPASGANPSTTGPTAASVDTEEKRGLSTAETVAANENGSPAGKSGAAVKIGHADYTDGLIQEKPTSKGLFDFKGWLFWLRHPNHVPKFPDYFYYPDTALPADVQREAFLDPSITSPTPSLWIIHDEMGISERETTETSKVLGCTDSGAWFNAKGKLETILSTPEGKEDPNVVEKAPVYEESPKY